MIGARADEAGSAAIATNGDGRLFDAKATGMTG